jgi:hypothetical protein
MSSAMVEGSVASNGWLGAEVFRSNTLLLRVSML